MRILLTGFGAVGRAFAALVEERRSDIARRHGFEPRLAGVATSRHTWIPEPATPPAPAAIRDAPSVTELPGRTEPWNGTEAIGRIEADLLAEATSGSLESGEPASTHVRAALARRLHVAAASKGAFVWHYRELADLARSAGVELRIGAAAGAALPTIDLALYGLAGSKLELVEGVLNGTSNYILTRMAIDGSTYADALAEARELGVAEADPRVDVEGLDTASKIVLLANAIADAGLRLSDVATTGITDLGPADFERAAGRGRVIRLVGRLERTGGSWRGTVQPQALAADHPLASVSALEKGITYVTDTMARVTLIGGRSDPNGAAAALLRDVINIGGERGRQIIQRGRAR